MRDIFPYFGASITLVVAHAIFYFTRNMMLPIWLIFLVVPLAGAAGPGDNQNISDKLQMVWANDKRFCYPLYSYSFLCIMQWIWCLIVMSDLNTAQYEFFNFKPETNGEYFQFCLLFGFFAGLSGIVGHELVHRKEANNKYLGCFLYTKAFYSHFLDEHIKGHHKHVATPQDSTTAS